MTACVSFLSDQPSHLTHLLLTVSHADCARLKIISLCSARGAFSLFESTLQHIQRASSWRVEADLLCRIMAELAVYPAVALLYFFGVSKASRDDRVELDDRASLNVFCLFVLAQPLCLVIGGYTGMATYTLTALVSFYFLPWKAATQQPDKEKDSKKKKEKKKKSE